MAFISLRTAKKWFRSEINAIFFRCFRKNVVFSSGSFFILPYPSLSFFLNLPIADSALGAVKTDTDFYQSLALCMIWQHIAFFVYLCQSLLGTLVNLQFENIYRIWHVHHGISSADGALIN